MPESPLMPYLLCMLAGPRSIILTAANSSHNALRYAAGSRGRGGNRTPRRLWIEARDRPATVRMATREDVVSTWADERVTRTTRR
jgi:hypothetical protein